MASGEFIGFNVFAFACVVILCLMIGLWLKKRRFRYLSESAAFIIIGFIVGLLGNVSSKEESEILNFDPTIVFFVLLPPIIFDAGYTLKRKDFFANFGSIVLYAVVGTIITCIVFGYFLFIFAYYGWIPLDGSSPLECLLFGAIISATDPVAVLAMLNVKEVNADPLLYSLVFGESVLNDAISIVLFQAFLPFVERSISTTTADAVPSFSVSDFFEALGNFVLVSTGSICVGLAVALLCCFIFKHINFRDYPVYEFTLVFLFAYSSYFLGELSRTSGIMALFFCSVCLAHYNFYNISRNAQIATHEAFRSVAQIAETFVFVYIGIKLGMSITANSHDQRWSFKLIFVSILGCLIGRAAHVFPLSFILNLRRRVKIPFRMQIPIWFAGLRGAVSFALALKFPEGASSAYVVTSTLVLLLFTTIVMGGFTLPVLHLTGMAGERRRTEGNTSLLTQQESKERKQEEADIEADGVNESEDINLDENGRTVTETGSPIVANPIGSKLLPRLHIDSAANGDADGDDDDDDGEELNDDGGSAPPSPHHNREPHTNYSGWVGRFKRFDRTFMRKWFGGRRDRLYEEIEKQMEAAKNSDISLVEIDPNHSSGSNSESESPANRKRRQMKAARSSKQKARARRIEERIQEKAAVRKLDLDDSKESKVAVISPHSRNDSMSSSPSGPTSTAVGASVPSASYVPPAASVPNVEA